MVCRFDLWSKMLNFCNFLKLPFSLKTYISCLDSLLVTFSEPLCDTICIKCNLVSCNPPKTKYPTVVDWLYKQRTCVNLSKCVNTMQGVVQKSMCAQGSFPG